MEPAEIDELLDESVIPHVITATLDLPSLLADHGIDVDLTIAPRHTKHRAL